MSLKGILNLLPALIGTAQALLPIVKEIIINVIRVLDVLPWEIDAEKAITKVNEIYDIVYKWAEVVKNIFIVK